MPEKWFLIGCLEGCLRRVSYYYGPGLIEIFEFLFQNLFKIRLAKSRARLEQTLIFQWSSVSTLSQYCMHDGIMTLCMLFNVMNANAYQVGFH